jgi:hypothetical protein
MARGEHVDIQFRTWTQRNVQSNSQSPEYMVLKTVTAANEVPDYTQLQQQIHDALRAQHPEWVQLNGDSPTCDAYEWRLAELLRKSSHQAEELASNGCHRRVQHAQTKNDSSSFRPALL